MNDDFFNKENNMKVAKNTVVSIAYQVRTQDGVLVDEAPANQPSGSLPITDTALFMYVSMQTDSVFTPAGKG